SLRPPLILDGGDFFTDGEGVCFTSTETLLRNGSNEEDMNMLFKLYFGCMRTIYLRPLPGPTVKHIDMFFKLVDSNTILLGKYRKRNNDNDPAWFLQKKAEEILDDNERLIYSIMKDTRKDLRIIRIPMPDIIWEIDKDKEDKRLFKLIENIM